MKINLIGQIYGCMGIPNHTRDLFREICRQEPDAKIYPLAKSEDPYDIDDLLRSRIQDEQPKTFDGITFIFWTPDIYEAIVRKCNRKNSLIVGYPIFEWTRFSDSFIHGIGQVDYIALSSKWAQETAISNGILDRKTLVIPAGVRSEFQPEFGDELTQSKNFLYIAKNEKRKSVNETIAHFQHAFPNGEKVLDIKLTDPHDPKFDPSSKIPINTIGKTFTLIGHLDKISDMVLQYNQHRFILVPSRSGGTELPMLEAMACGCLPIVTDYSGMAHYLPENYPFKIKVDSMVPMYDDRWFKPNINWGTWAEPDWKQFERLLQFAASMDEEERVKLQCELAAHIEKNFMYDGIVKSALHFLGIAYEAKQKGSCTS
jgi:glycosyltransferase involved in cell wall biosynthesis